MQQHTAEPVGSRAPQKRTIDMPFCRRLTVEPHPNKPGMALCNLFASGGTASENQLGFFEMDARTGAAFVGAIMDSIAATTVLPS